MVTFFTHVYFVSCSELTENEVLSSNLKYIIMKKLTAYILIFCVLNISFIGCATSKLVSIEEVNEMANHKYLIIHTPKKKYKLVDYAFSDHKLEGKLEILTKYKGFNIHVYTLRNFPIKLDKNSSEYVELLEPEISKITYKKEKVGMSILLAAGGILGIVFLIGIIDIAVNGIDINL